MAGTPSSILDQVQTLLAADTRSTHDIAVAANVGYYWLRKLRQRKIQNPGIQNVERLLTALQHA